MTTTRALRTPDAVPCTTAPGSVSAANPAAPTGPVTLAAPAAPAVLVRPDWACLDGPGCGGDLPGAITEIRFRGPHTDYHVSTPAGTLLIRAAGPPRADRGPVRWSLLRARLMPTST